MTDALLGWPSWRDAFSFCAGATFGFGMASMASFTEGEPRFAIAFGAVGIFFAIAMGVAARTARKDTKEGVAE